MPQRVSDYILPLWISFFYSFLKRTSNNLIKYSIFIQVAWYAQWLFSVFFLSIHNIGCWKDGLVFNSTWCSCRGPDLVPRAHIASLTACMSSFSDWHLRASERTGMHTTQRDIYIHINEIKIHIKCRVNETKSCKVGNVLQRKLISFEITEVQLVKSFSNITEMTESHILQMS